MAKTRAFIRYLKGKLVPGSLITTNGEYPKAPFSSGKWQEIPYDLCCTNGTFCNTANYGKWKLVTGGEAGDGVVLVDDLDPGDCPQFTFVGPNDLEDDGWVYLTQYFSAETCLQINYEYANFDSIIHDRPVYWTSSTQPTGIPGDLTPRVEDSPEDGTWNVTVPAGQWFSIGLYSDDSCCGRGFLTVEICEVECPEPTTTTTTTTELPEPTTTTTTTELSFAPICVSEAGTTEVNGTYTYAGMVEGKPFYVKGDYMVRVSGGLWVIKDNTLGSDKYASNDVTATPDLVTTWFTLSGIAPLPIVTAGACP
jgi:hypothetical protein